jgi:hypothetical protein
MESNKLKGQIINLNGLLNKKNYEMDSIITRQKFGLEILMKLNPCFHKSIVVYTPNHLTLANHLIHQK